MALASVLHSLAWVLFQNVAEAFPGQEITESRKTFTVSQGSIFPHCQNFDDCDRAFDLLLMQGILVQIPFPHEMAAFSMEKEFNVYRLQLAKSDLNQHIATFGIHKDTPEPDLIGSFLDLARKLGRGPGLKDLAPIPVRPGPVAYPTHFAAAVSALSQLGYCLQAERRMAWLPKVRTIMISEGIWENDRLMADVWREQLYGLISVMPEQLRMIVTKEDGAVSSSLMYWALRHYWDPVKGWCADKRDQPLDSRHHPFSMEQLKEIEIAE
jgi:hypothetical protein